MWDSWVGKNILKVSGKPFKSGKKTDIAVAIENNPRTNELAFVLKTCGSLVNCKMCYIKE